MIKTDFNNLKTLVVMQLKDKTDLSYLKSPRKTLFAVAGKLGQFVLAGAAFFLFLFLASLLKLFSFTGIVPTTVMTAAYTLFFVLSVVGCTAGLTEALYLSADNRVLLTLPVRPDMVFFSKLIEGKYPDYNRVIIRNHKITVLVDRECLIGALERAALVTEEKVPGAVRPHVKLQVEGNVLKITAVSGTGSS